MHCTMHRLYLAKLRKQGGDTTLTLTTLTRDGRSILKVVGCWDSIAIETMKISELAPNSTITSTSTREVPTYMVHQLAE